MKSTLCNTITLRDNKDQCDLSSDNDYQIDESTEDPNQSTPFVRYATTGEDGVPQQLPRLHPLEELTPADAEFVSPVYFLTEQQVTRHDDVLEWDETGGWRVSESKCIAQEMQNACEEEDQVRYPLFVESDADISFPRMREGLKRFIRDVLEVNPDDGKWYFSGGRSLHVHLPYYVRDTALRRLRRETEVFNADADVTIDASNYSRKSLVRLPGAVHHNRGTEKRPVAPNSSDTDLCARIAQMVAGVSPNRKRKEISYTAGNVETTRFSLSEELGLIKNIPTPLTEQQKRPTKGADRERWKQYNRHPFSPYANTGNERRSVAVLQVKGTPYCRDAEADIDGGIFVPGFVYGAVGADGEYTMWSENGRIRLSKPDYDKWNYEHGDTVVLIGGHSNNSRIIKLEHSVEWQAVVGVLLHDSKWGEIECDGRQEALALLQDMGYEVGSAGKNGPYRSARSSESDFTSSHTYRLQKRAERDGVETLSHQERLHVGNRLLAISGWDEADEWFQEQFGERYDPKVTHDHLRSILKKYDDLHQ